MHQVNVRIGSGAEFALRGGVGVEDVAAIERAVGFHVLAAGLVTRGVEGGIFDVGASDFGVRETGREHAVDEVGEG